MAAARLKQSHTCQKQQECTKFSGVRWICDAAKVPVRKRFKVLGGGKDEKFAGCLMLQSCLQAATRMRWFGVSNEAMMLPGSVDAMRGGDERAWGGMTASFAREAGAVAADCRCSRSAG